MMKKISFYVLLSMAMISSSCNKEKTSFSDVGAVAFINAAPGVGGIGTEPGLHIFIDSLMKTFSVIPYLGSSGYLTATPGPKSILVISSLDTLTKFFEVAAETFETNKGVTYMVYDTLSATDSTLNAVRLTDDLTAPPTGFINFRFINVAVASTPLDVVFVRNSPNDSIIITNQAYIGNAPNAAALSPFNKKLPLGAYTIKLKEAGTQNLLAFAPINLGSYSSIYTFYATGLAAGFPLEIGGFKHYP